MTYDIRTQFNAGELSPLMEGRLDFAKTQAGAKTMLNFIPTVQGPAKRRPGSRYVATTKTEGDRVWLRPFQASLTEQYVLEIGDEYIRFYTNHGQLAGPYEVVTPYQIADLTTTEGTCALSFAQSNDVLYITHPLYPPATLSRTGVGTFSFTQSAVGVGSSGPFKDLNTDQSITLSANTDTGAVTITASTGIFLNGIVGKHLYIQEGINVLVHQWEPSKAVSAGDRRRANGLNYIASTSGTTGTIRPIHTEGKRWDGDGGVQWEFTDDGSGVVLVGALVGAQPTNVVTGTVVKRLPYSVTSGPGGSTHRYAMQAWTADDGYPQSVCFFRERLCFARGQTIWTSVAADFTNFSFRDGGQVTADSAITLTLAGDHKDPIAWMCPDKELIVGTASSEYAIAEYTNGQPFGPANVKAERQSTYGSRGLQPLAIGSAILYAQRGGRVVNEMSFDFRQDQYLSSDLSSLSEHITKVQGLAPFADAVPQGVVDWTWALRKDRIVWMARGDGALLGLTYNREQEVVAWHRHHLGHNGVSFNSDTLLTQVLAKVESVCAIASPSGEYDDLWLVVNRQGIRHIEWIGQPVQTWVYNSPYSGVPQPGGGQPLPRTLPAGRGYYENGLWEVDQFYVDSGLSHIPSTTFSGTPDAVTTVSGLSHLNGAHVQVLTDGVQHPDCQVLSGSITLQYAAYTVHVGLKYPSVLETMQINPPTPMGSAQSRLKRISSVVVRFHETLGGQIGPTRSVLSDVRLRTAQNLMDTYTPFLTGDYKLDWPGGFLDETRVYIKQDRPFSMTVCAIVPSITVYGQGLTP